eukprot:4292677-Amphidinium_carterae.1
MLLVTACRAGSTTGLQLLGPMLLFSGVTTDTTGELLRDDGESDAVSKDCTSMDGQTSPGSCWCKTANGSVGTSTSGSSFPKPGSVSLFLLRPTESIPTAIPYKRGELVRAFPWLLSSSGGMESSEQLVYRKFLGARSTPDFLASCFHYRQQHTATSPREPSCVSPTSLQLGKP